MGAFCFCDQLKYSILLNVGKKKKYIKIQNIATAKFSLHLCLLLYVLQKQLFGIEAPTPAELTGWRKHLNSYTLQGRRNVYNTLNVNICRVLIKGISLIHICVTVCSLTVCVGHLWDLCCNSCCLLDTPTAEKKVDIQLCGLRSC